MNFNFAGASADLPPHPKLTLVGNASCGGTHLLEAPAEKQDEGCGAPLRAGYGTRHDPACWYRHAIAELMIRF